MLEPRLQTVILLPICVHLTYRVTTPATASLNPPACPTDVAFRLADANRPRDAWPRSVIPFSICPFFTYRVPSLTTDSPSPLAGSTAAVFRFADNNDPHDARTLLTLPGNSSSRLTAGRVVSLLTWNLYRRAPTGRCYTRRVPFPLYLGSLFHIDRVPLPGSCTVPGFCGPVL